MVVMMEDKGYFATIYADGKVIYKSSLAFTSAREALKDGNNALNDIIHSIPEYQELPEVESINNAIDKIYREHSLKLGPITTLFAILNSTIEYLRTYNIPDEEIVDAINEGIYKP